MKKTIRIAAIATALAAIAVMSAGCRNEKQIAEDFAAAAAGSEAFLALDAGEILLHESIKLDRDVEGHAVNSVTEAYIKYAMNGSELDYDLGATITRVVGGAITSYDAWHENGKFEQYLNDKAVPESEIAQPDIFDRFRITFGAEDIERIDVATGSGVVLYAMTMTDAYADSYDTEKDGVKYDCTRVVYNCYLDKEGVLRQILSEQTATMTDAEGSQQVVKFSQAISE